MKTIALVLSVLRIYWPVDCAQYALKGSAHTHVQITGYIAFAKKENDGDLHIRVVPTKGASKPFFTAECIPAMPCTAPAANDHVRIKGITRRDFEHAWNEIHPIEKIEVIK